MALGLIARIRGERETVGIDVGHYSIKYVKVYHDANGKRIVREVDLEPVPAGSIINGLIQRRDSDDMSAEKGAKKEKDGFDKLGEAFSKLLLRHPIDENVDVIDLAVAVTYDRTLHHLARQLLLVELESYGFVPRIVFFYDRFFACRRA